MKYEDALKAWGAFRLSQKAWNEVKPEDIDLETVIVKMMFNEGYACCNGYNPDCYCSLAESPSADVNITGYTKDERRYVHARIDVVDFDFVKVLQEIVAVGNGEITS